MMIDEKIVREVLETFGFTLEEILGIAAKKPKAEQDFIYLLHHMHQNEKDPTKMEELHHCVVFEKKNLKGKKWEQIHIKDGKVIQHVLDIPEDKLDTAPEVVYDHLNNGFKIKIMEIDNKKFAVIYGLTSVKDTKWSDMDKVE